MVTLKILVELFLNELNHQQISYDEYDHTTKVAQQ